MKVAGRRAREKKSKVSFLSYLFSSLVPKIDPSTLAKRLCEMKRDPERIGEGREEGSEFREIGFDRFEGKCGRGKESWRGGA